MLQNKKILNILVVLTLATGLSLTGCESATNSGSPSQGDVTLQFATPISSASKAKISSSNQLQQTSDTLTIEGNNGKLIIHDLRFIVEDFELERSDGECEDTEGGAEDQCEEFESKPFFVDLPLQGDTLNLDTAPIQPGLYKELEFELDDLDLDEEDGEEREYKQQLINQVRGEFPDWPDEVSMVIIGDFISSQGDTTAFKTFAEAELEIEIEFSPPLEVGENTVNKLLRVNIDPAAWFLRNDGTVRDLSQYDYESTGQILEFEVEIENGFKSVEVDEDDEQNDDD
ncbi:hypothetical protein NC796_05065 [Aliifodinibius sp. S!AR15-10]|uniref:hypothetical protein n=1 Tax=Aliifodinibius sp. S!AR15-10 TaxID=2950437 RepID=UPI0028653BD7|nr:hypothetical protein [Aliifodinibius sp. S!AR15-10]MDR8390502.1 hypothetical protein [Aliifodinibius sp. S!AR15-10]